MRFVASVSLVLAGLILILWVSGSISGVEANTIGGVLLLLGFVSALVLVALHASRDEGGPGGRDEPTMPWRR